MADALFLPKYRCAAIKNNVFSFQHLISLLILYGLSYKRVRFLSKIENGLPCQPPSTGKIFERTVVTALGFRRKTTSGQLPQFEVILKTIATYALMAASGVGTGAFFPILFFFTFHFLSFLFFITFFTILQR